MMSEINIHFKYFALFHDELSFKHIPSPYAFTALVVSQRET